MKRLRTQVEGAAQALVVAFVLIAALAVSNLPYPWNTVVGRYVRWIALGELAALALLYVATRPRTLRLRAGVPALAALFVSIALTSAAWSPFPVLTLGRGATLAVLLVAAAGIAYGTGGRADAVALFLAALLAIAVVIAVGGLIDLWAAPGNASVPATTGTPWRYNGLGADPNTMPMVLALATPLALWALFDVRSRIGRVVFGAVFVLLDGSIVASGSRGALIAAFVGSLVVSVGLFRTRRTYVYAAACFVAILALNAGITQLPERSATNPIIHPEFGERLPISSKDATLKLPLQDEIGLPRPSAPQVPRTLFDTGGRVSAWRGAFDQAMDRPVVGYGFGAEEKVFVDRWYSYFSSLVENSYLGTLLQLGFVGLFVLFALITAIVAEGFRALTRLPDRSRRLAAACLGVVAGGIVLGCVQSYLTTVGSPAVALFWFTSFLLVALGSVQQPE